MSRVGIALLVLAALVITMPAQARIPLHPAMVDIRRDLLPGAIVIVRGRIVGLNPRFSNRSRFFTIFEADRWYRGPSKVLPTLSFTSTRGAPGDGCGAFEPGTYWLLFARVEADGRLKVAHDCHGALQVSGRLAPASRSRDMLDQMEADFEAGLGDPDPAARLASIQRLGNLKQPGARPVLRRLLDSCSESEKPWVVLAVLQTGDTSVLPQAASILGNWKLRAGGEPQAMIAADLSNVADPAAVPGLLEILRTAADPLVKSAVLDALGDKIRDPRALADIAEYLGNADRYVNHNALVGVWNMTRAPACSLQHWKEEDIPAITQSCKAWWESEGKLRVWAAR